MASNEVIDGLSGAAVRHVLKFDASKLSEPLADEVLLCASARCGVAHSWVLFCHSDQFSNSSNAERGMNSQDLSLLDHLNNGHQFFNVVNVEVQNVRRTRHHIGCCEKRVAVRWALSHCFYAEHPSGARFV